MPFNKEEFFDYFAETFDLNREDVKDIILNDWAAREVAEMTLFGKRKSTDVRPFVTDDDTGDILMGPELFQTLLLGYQTDLLKQPKFARMARKWDKRRAEQEKTIREQKQKLKDLGHPRHDDYNE